jgi:hypothetical protein
MKPKKVTRKFPLSFYFALRRKPEIHGKKKGEVHSQNIPFAGSSTHHVHRLD